MLHSECESEYIVLLVVRFTYHAYSETKDVTSLSYYERCDWSVQRPVLYCIARFSSCRFDRVSVAKRFLYFTSKTLRIFKILRTFPPLKSRIPKFLSDWYYSDLKNMPTFWSSFMWACLLSLNCRLQIYGRRRHYTNQRGSHIRLSCLSRLSSFRIGIWRCWFLCREENRRTQRKTLGAWARARPQWWDESASTIRAPHEEVIIFI